MTSLKLIVVTFMALSSFTFYDVEPISFLAITPGNAIGGMVTGIIGLALGSVSLAIVLGKIELVDEPMETGYGGYRKKRSAKNDEEDFQIKQLEVEQLMDSLYQSDPSRCIEKMICEITERGAKGFPISEEEEAILGVVQHNINHGFTFKKMLMAQKVALGNGDCEFLFDSCPLQTFQMVKFISETAKHLQLA